jgi:hypothetical protein
MVSQLPSRRVRFSGARADMVGLMSFLPSTNFPHSSPDVVARVYNLETQARESGRSLAPFESNLAQNVGVAHPGEVRILLVPTIPLPAHPRVKQLARQVGPAQRRYRGSDSGVRRHCSPRLRK